ncbi:MAG: inositol monophosphatase [Candidatus Omnitrophica bacterium]|nr:inositol monophosphatase [Candidatus Omnitrophota bacterium]
MKRSQFPLPKIRSTALKIAVAAGEMLLRNYGRIRSVHHKGSHAINLVTDIDKKSEAFIVKNLLKKFPDHQILAEEGSLSKTSSPYKWIIDPIDGTTNFAHGFPFFCVSIGLEVDREVSFGIVYAPMLRELFIAERKKGATLNGKKIHVSTERQLDKSLLATGFPYDVRVARRNNLNYFSSFIKKARAIRRAGSAAIDLCYVACGRFDGFWEMRLAPWDLAAAVLMVEEAGGKVTNFSGRKLNLYGDDTVASNGKIHTQLLHVIRKLKEKE